MSQPRTIKRRISSWVATAILAGCVVLIVAWLFGLGMESRQRDRVEIDAVYETMIVHALSVDGPAPSMTNPDCVASVQELAPSEELLARVRTKVSPNLNLIGPGRVTKSSYFYVNVSI